jgi:uncharacterized OsmC-like protein
MKTLNTQPTTRMIAALLIVAMALNLGMATRNPADDKGSKPGKKKEETTWFNGYPYERIFGTVEAIQANPELGKFQFRATNKWIKGGHNRSTIQGFYGAGKEDDSRKKPFIYDNSEPPSLLGNNEGANPVEYILHGLAGCMTTTITLHAAANGIELTSVESRLEGDLDVQGFLGINDQVRNGYQQIRVEFTIKGNMTEEQKEMLESFARKSPVFDIVTNKVPVQVAMKF